MKTKSKVSQRLLSFVMVLVTLFGALFSSSLPVHASSLNLDEPTEYYYTGVSPHLGYELTQKVYVLKMDGKKVFCVESGIRANSGEGYVPESYVDARKDKLSKIAYYGYTSTSQTHYDYVVVLCQVLVQVKMSCFSSD